MPELQRESHMPLYHQLKELLTDKIGSGEWTAGHKLPTEVQLASEFGVSRVTVRQAMQLLERGGLVERRQGAGTFVGRAKVAHNLMNVFNSGTDILRTGNSPKIRLHYVRRVKASASIATQLRLKTGDEVYELQRSCLADEEPILLFTSWLPADLFPDFVDKGWERRTIWDVLHEYGIFNAVQHKEVEITLLDGEEADLLATQAGSPALLVTYLTSMTEGRPFEFRRMLLRGDHCKYFLDLDRAEAMV
jgi:GntR family transcriptional regulator